MPANQPSRRAVLRAGALGLVSTGLLGGCSGERLRTPWSPDPTQDAALPKDLPPDGELILLARERVHRYRSVLPHLTPRSASGRRAQHSLGELWPVQQDRLESLLTLAGVELPDLATVPMPTGAGGDGAAATTEDDGSATTGRDGSAITQGDDASTTSALPDIDLEVLGAQIRDDLPTVLAELARSTATNRPMLTSLTAQHAESARLLRAPVDWAPLAGPTGAGAVPVLQVTRPAVFGLEVVAARSRGEERELFESVLRPLASITRALTTLAGEAAPVPPLGYDLPEPLSDADDRLTLARTLVHDVAPAALSVVDRAGGDPAQLESVVRIVAEATTWARSLQSPGVPFPGMTLP